MSLLNYERVKKHVDMLHQPGNEVSLENFMKRKRAADKKYREKKLKSKRSESYKKKKSHQALESIKKRKALENLQAKDIIGTRYKSKIGLTKAVKKVKNSLPNELEKQVEVVEEVAANLNMTLKSHESSQKISRQRHSFLDVPAIVTEFYLLDSVSRQLPGKKDVITIMADSGFKEKYQKRVMLTSIDDAYLEFTSLYPHIKIGRSKFYELRPKYVLLLSQTPHNVCCCIYCGNFKFIFEALKPFLREDIQNCSDFVMKFMCLLVFDCANSSCDGCMDYNGKLKEILIDSCGDHTVKWLKWDKVDNFFQKREMTGKTVSDVANEFAATIEKYKLHKYLVHTQHNILNNLKLDNDDSSIILHLDYSENFSIAVQDEIQSAYYKRKQLSIFTAVAFVGKYDTISFAIVNDDTKHQKEQVAYYIKLIIDILRSTYDVLTYIHFVSDGCAAQFKNKYILSSLTYMEDDYNLKPYWHFMPTSHGKSCADGIGGSLKRQVSHRILSGLYEVHDARTFVDCATSFAKNINILYASEDDMNDATSMFKERWAKVKSIPHTQSCHYFEPSGNQLMTAISSKKDGLNICNI